MVGLNRLHDNVCRRVARILIKDLHTRTGEFLDKEADERPLRVRVRGEEEEESPRGVPRSHSTESCRVAIEGRRGGEHANKLALYLKQLLGIAVTGPKIGPARNVLPERAGAGGGTRRTRRGRK